MELKQECIEEKEQTTTNKKQKIAEKEVDEASEEKVVVKSEKKVFAQQGLAASMNAAKAQCRIVRAYMYETYETYMY